MCYNVNITLKGAIMKDDMVGTRYVQLVQHKDDLIQVMRDLIDERNSATYLREIKIIQNKINKIEKAIADVKKEINKLVRKYRINIPTNVNNDINQPI